MGQFVVRGGRRLEGTVRINGAKNAALPIMAASLLTDRPVVLQRVPDLRDVRVMIQVLQSLGVEVSRDGEQLTLDASSLKGYVIPQDLMQEMRASIFVMGPILARLGKVQVIQPGGCAIGDRPIDLHLAGFRRMGAEVTEEDGVTCVSAARLKGGHIHLAFPSVGATENLLMAAALAEGETYILNAAMEPEVVDLAQFLTQMGCLVRGAGTPEIRVSGATRLEGTSHAIIPDRIETATFALAAAMTQGRLYLQDCLPDHLPGFWDKLREAGVNAVIDDAENVMVDGRAGLAATSLAVSTGPYPGFATDVQPQFMAFLCTVPGRHTIVERVFESRMGHAGELRRLGGHIEVEQRVARIRGGTTLKAATVRALDLRAGAAVVLGALAAQGESHIMGREVVERGYADLAERMRAVGGDIWTA